MKWLPIVLILMIATTAHGGVVWEDGSFKLEEAGFAEQDVFSNWIGIKCGLTIPDDGWLEIVGEGALELYFPESGEWKLDQGIVFLDTCNPTPDGSRDTSNGTCGVNAEFRCPKQGNRILMIVRINRMFPTKANRPTKARWVYGRSYYGEE